MNVGTRYLFSYLWIVIWELMFLQPLVDEPDSSSAAAKSSGDESTEKTTNKTPLTTNTDPYDFDSQEALKKSKVVKLKVSSSYWCL